MNVKDKFIEDRIKNIFNYFIRVGIYGIDSSVIRKSLEETWDKAAISKENDIDPYRGEDDD